MTAIDKEQRIHPLYVPYWGKAATAGEEIAWHPLVYHSLDVAAVGEAYLSRNISLRRRLTSLIGLPEEVWLSWFRFFIALHDLGKFSYNFQDLRPEVLRLCRNEPGLIARSKYTLHHSSMGYLFWTDHLSGISMREKWFAEDTGPDMQEIVDVWMAVCAGHHGQPPESSDPQFPESPLWLGHYFSARDSQAAEAFAQWVLEHLPPIRLTVGETDPELLPRLQKASWILAGTAVLCDWLGSSTQFFSYCVASMPLEEYYTAHARPAADRVLAETGLLPLPASTISGFRNLFPSQKDRSPTPLQSEVETMALPGGPGLFILEDLTGSGKTEAALLLAHRLMQAGAGEGVMLALPTMATANAMHERISGCYRRLFQEGDSPSLSLAHSASRFQRDVSRQGLPPASQSRSQYSESDIDATVYCNTWIAEGRKRAFLADVGVCTVDQALLAVLPSRHQSLRLLGLSRKILVIDEVHAYDAYMNALIATLLEFHAGLGGSAILLSATLPGKMRRYFCKAFHHGLDDASADLPGVSALEPWPAFPLVTSLRGKQWVETPVAVSSRGARRIQVKLISEIGQGVKAIMAFHAQGACICWIRNTVYDAREAYHILKNELPSADITLFHARFALGDRLDIEKKVIEAVGPNSHAADRRGRIVIATQVVEQSLDLDFDEMFVDLAPMDLVLQRAGRLRRHSRDAQGNPGSGEDMRGPVTLHLLSPDPIADPESEWYTSLFPRAAFVYENHAQLWLTARKLADTGGWSLPEDSRNLIESVFGDQVQAPKGLVPSEEKSEGNVRAGRSMGSMNTLPFAQGYKKSDHWSEDTIAPTRLGKPAVQVILTCWDGVELLPWRSGEDWHAGELRIQLGSIDPEFADERSEWADARQRLIEVRPDLRHALIVGMKEAGQGRWTGNLPGKDDSRMKVEYIRETGFSFSKKDEGGAE